MGSAEEIRMRTDTIPVIDIARLHDAETLTALDSACRDWGFFQVTNHGIPDAVTANLHAAMHAFFGLPTGVKRAIARNRENPWGFFDRELTKNALDRKQIFDVGPGNGAAIAPQWPRGMPGFREAVTRYNRACEQLAYKLLAAISVNLGMSPGFLSRSFGPSHTSFLRLNYYPVCRDEGGFGVHHHTDAGALTILLQDEQPGLEVCREGAWHLVQPRHDALVINIGDIIQVWSNDLYKAALHRVIASAEKPRYSAPYFFNPEYRSNYAPIPTTISSDRPARYGAINWGEFRALRADGDYADYGDEVQIDHYRTQA
jgi:isopenicillin N synthase-like dioxygenase